MLYFKLSSLTCPVMPGGGGVGQWACLELTEPLKVVAGVVGEYFSDSDQVFWSLAIMGACVMTVMLV